MLDPLDFLDPILHILKFVYKIFDVAKTYFHLFIENVEWFLRWMFARHEPLRNLGLLAAALIGLPLLIWRGVSLDRSSKAAQKQAENTEFQMRNLEKQAENASKSHVADTYTRAIEQLGAVDNKGEPHIELRLGGLYALEKIAQANKDYHPQIMEVLCAYVRMHCPKDPGPDGNDLEHKFESLRIDIQVCLTVIGRRNVSFDKASLDLSEVQIRGAFLSNTNLSGADLIFANLSWSNLFEVNLIRANLREANLKEASFNEGDLSGADLSGADLSGAYLHGTNLRGAFLNKVVVSKARPIEGSIKLIRANLKRAGLKGADLRGTDLRVVENLTCEQIQSANIDRETKLPDYLKITWADDDTYTCEMVEESK